MNDEQRPIDFKIFAAFAILIALVLLLPVYWKWIGYRPSPTGRTPQVDSMRVAGVAADSAARAAAVAGTVRSADTTGKVSSGLFVRDSLWSERLVTVTTPLYQATFSTRGARLMRQVLQRYQYNDPERHGRPIVLLDTLDAAAGAGPRFRFDNDAIDLADAPFVVDQDRVTLAATDSATLHFTATTSHGGVWTVTYVFRGDRYDFRTHLLIPAPWQDGVERELYYGWQGGLWPTEPDPAGDNGDFAALALMGKDLEQIGRVDRERPFTDHSGLTRWAAVRTKYFVCAAIPTNAEAEGFRAEAHERPLVLAGNTIQLKQFSAAVRMGLRAGAPVDLVFTVYAGPIDYDVLKRYGVGLEEMVNLGWRWLVRPFSLIILWLFQNLYSIIPNYGIVIILFSLLIKAIFHPLTKKQVRSMRRMQAMQPKLEKLRERFKEDPQRLNQEMMKLYKEAGINPLAGCLPLLPQMPIFYALFQVFRTTIELRGAHFVGWLTDLSQKDPYYILPIVMTVSMFMQQRMSTKDPKQKMLTYLLPVLFGFMFKNFAAGLTLYWTMFNIFSVIEQAWLIGHPTDGIEDADAQVGTGRLLKTKVGK